MLLRGKERLFVVGVGAVTAVAVAVWFGSMSAELQALRPLRQQVKLLRALPMVGEYVPRFPTKTLAGDSIT